MEKNLKVTITVVWIFAALVACSAVNHTEDHVGMNPQGDLLGENMGDHIAFNWPPQDGATEYIIYRSLSLNGPWEEIDRIDDEASRTAAAKLDVTPLAWQVDLCYRVEAIDAKRNVPRRYEAMCVPKFTGK